MATDYKEELQVVGKRAKALYSAAPETMKAFGQLHHNAVKEGALDGKTKELMAVAISIIRGCEDCILFHIAAASKAGATREDLLDTIGVAVLMGGGPASVYGASALDIYDGLSAQ